MFRICFVWVYIIKGKFIPFVKLASISEVCLAYIFTLVGDILPLPEVVWYKGKQNGFLRALLPYNFLRQFAFLSLIKSGRLEKIDQLSSRCANVQKRGLAIGLFCGTLF